jgi:uncharacterized protein (DUF2062 family)
MKPLRAGFSIGVGLFIGVQPLYGLHLPLCIAVCWPLRLDVVLAYAAANISNPFTAPLIVTAELQLGSLMTDGRWLGTLPRQLHAAALGHIALSAFLGAFVLGLVLSLTGGLLAALAAVMLTAKASGGTAAARRELAAAINRTCARYRFTACRDRCYVAIKLRYDPVIRALGEIRGSLGQVIDI